MENLWLRINHLVPEPQCQTRNGKILQWDDKRKRPTKKQLEDVDVDRIILSDRLTQVVQNHLDSSARFMGYDDISTAISYADEPQVPDFQKEGLMFRKWRSLVWESYFQIVGTCSITITDQQLIEQLPILGG